ncbi:unnamed protein product [Caenorhabditis brenneri]
MALTSVSVYELSRLSSYPPPPPHHNGTVRRRSNSTKVRRKDESVDRRRKSQNQDPITITYLGRPRSPSLTTSPPIPTVIRQRKPSPTVTTIKKVPSVGSISASPTRKSVPPGRKTSSPSGSWTDCIEAVNEIGVVAKKENRNIRRLKMAFSRRIKVGDDEEMVLTAVRVLSRWNGWSLDTCHDYLPIIIDNITSIDNSSRSTALEGLAAISDVMIERLIKFSNVPTHRIGVDVAAEERAEKAKACLQHLRSVVKKRDWYYRQLDEVSIDKLDATMERLKKL